MRDSLVQRFAALLAALLVISVILVDAGAQQRRRKRSRRVTNPVTNQATTNTNAPGAATSDPTIISTADDSTGAGRSAGNTNSAPASGQGAAASESEPEAMRRTINRLSNQVTRLSDRLNEMEQSQRTLVDLERLTRAEQRIESLRAQLRDVVAKEADLQARADQLEYDLDPQNIERVVALAGTTRPEEARDARRRQLENERTRVRGQLDLLAQSRTHLESDIALAEADAETIRQRIASQTSTTPATTAGPAITTVPQSAASSGNGGTGAASPTPTPYASPLP